MSYMISMFIFLPLLSSGIAGVSCFFKKNKWIAYVNSMLIFFALLLCLEALYYLNVTNHQHFLPIKISDWIDIVDVDFSFMIDEISCIMSCVVLFVAFLVHIYSIFYMENDEGFNKFFAYLGLFVFSMLVLVTSDNFLLLFVGWEGVGLCSWLLIGFWYNNDKYSYAANEAFIMNRITDFVMLVGIFYIYVEFGTLKYTEVFMYINNDFKASIIALLLFVGAMGKSAQFPFHTWLADAMAGPTPASALIHAATMVTAGVYLIIRASYIFDMATDVGYFIACLGAFVVIFAALKACVNNDLKRIIAYSTLSQLGYMFVACGLGAYSFAFFHLVTHAFFKSLLFLGAGNVMHATNGNLNIKTMGKMYKSMKYTAILMIIGSLALSGIYPFSGFFSKDKIIDFAYFSGNFWIYIILLIGAFLTSFYSFRLIMLVFFNGKDSDKKIHEASNLAILPMAILAFFAIFAGFFEKGFFEYISKFFSAHIKHDFVLIFISLGVAIFGVFVGVLFSIYIKRDFTNNFFHKLLSNDYYIPKFYENVFVKGFAKISSLCAFIEKSIVDGFIVQMSLVLKTISKVFRVKTNIVNMIYYYLGGVLILLFIVFFTVVVGLL